MEVEKVWSSHASPPGRFDRARRVFGRSLTPTDTILVAHAADFKALHTMTREQIAWFRAGSALNAGPLIDPATGGKASLADAKLAPGDTSAKPGKDNR